jgi:hypothetical protein
MLPTAADATTPAVDEDSRLAQAMLESALEDAEPLARTAQSVLVGLGSTARLVTVADTPSVSAPLTLGATIRGGQFEAQDTWVTLWGDARIRLWDAASARPLSPILLSDVLYPQAAKVESGLLVSDPERARVWQWIEPELTSGTSAAAWLRAASGTWRDDADALQVLSPERWCESVRSARRQQPPVSCTDTN